MKFSAWRSVPAYTGVVAGIVLATRALVYELARSTPLATRLSGRLGGPRPVVVGAIALTAAVVLGAALPWLAAMGVRERWTLADSRTRGAAPRLDLGRFALRAVEARRPDHHAQHRDDPGWRAGLGFHGFDCLFGPVHVNAVPVTAALAIVAAAAIGAVEHLLRWARRVVARALGARPRPARARVALLSPAAASPPRRAVLAFEPLLPRPPPRLALAG